MYAASQAFHDAVRNGAHQIPLLIFEDAVFTTGDINVSSGIEFNDYFNTEEDLSIGQALSNELIFSLFNDYGMLNNYEFGDFEATIGAQIGNEEVSWHDGVYIQEGPDYAWETFSESPYIKRSGKTTVERTKNATSSSSFTLKNRNMYNINNISFPHTQIESVKVSIYSGSTASSSNFTVIGYQNGVVSVRYTGPTKTVNNAIWHIIFNCIEYTVPSVQPSSHVKSMLSYGNKLYVLDGNNNVNVYNASSGAYIDETVNQFMVSQMNKWTGKGIRYSTQTKILKIWQGTSLLTYEFVPLGHFTAKRPKVPNVIEIHFECLDYMQKFEVDMPSASELGITYPISIAGLLDAMCQYVGVQRMTGTFINSTATVTKHLDEFNNVTMREVLGWIAEAAAGVARFNRDGVLVIDWIHDTDTSMDESGYIEFLPYWYETRPVTELCNRASNGEYDSRVGNQTGDTYLIQDNPLLKGVGG